MLPLSLESFFEMLSVTSRGVFRFFFFSPRHVGWFKNIPCLVSCGVSWSPLCLASSLACAQTRPCKEAGEAPRGAREGRARDAPLGPGRRARAKAAGRPGFCRFLDLSRTRGAGPGFWGAERLCDLGPDASPSGPRFPRLQRAGFEGGGALWFHSAATTP